MTQEEKARAYDEALERARKYMAKGYDVLMPEIFPELAESEDERIRKGLIRYLESDRDCQPCQDISFYEEAIAWLEKHKESLHIEETCKENANSFTDDDERIRKELISYLTDIIDGISSEEDIPHDAKILGGKIRHWISYLEKQKEQKPVEWSEEDKLTIAELINYFEGDPLECSIEEMVQRIKSLRPSWKPSEEQMEALDEYIYAKDPNTEKYSKAVLSLRDELKELM